MRAGRKVLSIVEHPAFIRFYEELMEEGLVGEMDEEDDANAATTGDLIAVGLRPGYQEFDFAVPFILRDKEEEIQTREIDIGKLNPFTTFRLYCAVLVWQYAHVQWFPITGRSAALR
jgi:type III restriction enzyme